MKTSSIAAFTAAAVASLAAPAILAQSTAQSTDTGLRMPYQKDFWGTGHAGIQIGRSKLDVDCPTGGSCDDNANAFKAFAGGRFNNIFGGEISYFRTADFERSVGNLNTQLVNFGLLAGVPFGPNRNSSIFGKLGALWGHTEAGSASQNGWGGSYGLGATIGVTRDWAVRMDWDRYRIKLPAGGGDRENIDSLMIGAQYTFGNPR